MRRDIASLTGHSFDVVVIGAGIHGAWIAQRAAQTGLKTALIERGDFGAGTSANSLKVLHGGLRYLQHLDFRRMRASSAARREYARCSPHLIQPMACVMPLAHAGARSPWIFGPALLMNDLVSFDRNSGVAERAKLPAGRLLSSRRCRAIIGQLAEVDAVAGGQWWDAIALDTERLTLEAVLAAGRCGAAVANRVEACEYLVADGRVAGVVARDRISGQEFELRARATVNATGPWAAQLSRASGLAHKVLPAHWLGALNLVLRRSLGLSKAVALSSASRAADHSSVLRRARRELFFVPWRDVTMVGTDYHRVADPLGEDAAQPPAGSAAAFLEEVMKVAPRAGLSTEDVSLVHWGLQPTDDLALDVPRKSPLLAAGRPAVGADNLLIVVAEKLTSAPMLSRQVCKWIWRSSSPARGVKSTSAHAADVAEGDGPECDETVKQRLVARYGTRWPQVLAHAGAGAHLLQPVLRGRDFLGVEVVHAVREEMALSLHDIVRRVGICDVSHPGVAALQRIAQVAAPEFGWSENATRDAVSQLDASLRQERSLRLVDVEKREIGRLCETHRARSADRPS